MGRYILKRALRLVPVLVIVTLATTFMLDLVPGDPAVVIAGEGAPPEVIEAVDAQYGFKDSPIERYLRWVGDAVTGDLGSSYRTKQPVVDEILERLPVTLEIALLAAALALLIAIPTALFSASRVGSRFDRFVGAATSLVISIPVFLLALLLVYVLAVRNHVFPVTGWTRLSEDPVGNLRSAFLPALTLALGEAVIQTRVLRADAIQTLQEDYILMARAKGMPTWHVLLRHAFRPSSFSLLTLASLSLARLVGGTIVIETVFALPGIGRLAVTAITGKDLITVQGIVTFVAISYIVVNLVVDVLYAALDPRIRAQS